MLSCLKNHIIIIIILFIIIIIIISFVSASTPDSSRGCQLSQHPPTSCIPDCRFQLPNQYMCVLTKNVNIFFMSLKSGISG